MQAIITVNEGIKESAETKSYNNVKTIYINAGSVENAARLLSDHAGDEGEHIEVVSQKKAKGNIKVYNMDRVADAVTAFEESEQGKAFLQRVREAEATSSAGLGVIEARYLEALVFQGRSYEAFMAAFALGEKHTHK